MDSLQPTPPPAHIAGQPRWYDRDEEYQAWFINHTNAFWDAVNERLKAERDAAKKVASEEDAPNG